MARRIALADRFARGIGSWWFVGIQTIGLAVWVLLNTSAAFHWIAWDRYPFVFLNLMLSFQAAYTGPILLIAARRQEAIQGAQQKYMLHLLEGMRQILEDNDAIHRTGVDGSD